MLWCRHISCATRQVLFKFRCNNLISGKIIKEMPGSVASGTLCTSMLPPTRTIVLGLLLLFPIDIRIALPYYFFPLSTSTYNFIHFDFPHISITIHQVWSFRVSSIEMFTHSELRFYNFPNSIYTFLTSFSVQGLATTYHFLSNAIFVVLFFSPLSTSPALRLFSLPLFFLSYVQFSRFPSHKEHPIFCWKWV